MGRAGQVEVGWTWALAWPLAWLLTVGLAVATVLVSMQCSAQRQLRSDAEHLALQCSTPSS